MKSIKRRLKKELDSITPPFKGSGVSAEHVEAETAKKPFSMRFKAMITSACAVVCAVCILVCVFVFSPTAAIGYECVVLEINPSAVFLAENGVVTRAVSLNGDSDTVLSDGFAASIRGKKLEESIVLFVDRSARLGYLDLNAESAVRISTEKGGSKSLKKVSEALDGYFMLKGSYTAAAAREIPSGDFISLLGGTGSAAEIVNGLSLYYEERTLAGLPAEEISKTYEDNVIYGGIKNYLQGELSACIDGIERCASLTANLSVLNGDIKAHKDNPAVLIKDYFTVKNMYGDSAFTADFAALMAEADALYAEYISCGGIELNNSIELETAKAVLNSVDLEILRGLSDVFSDSAYDIFGDKIVEILNYMGIDTAFIADVVTVPEDAAAYMKEAEKLYSAQSALLEKTNRENYAAERPVISSPDYLTFKADIIAKYGSLDIFYESLAK